MVIPFEYGHLKGIYDKFLGCTLPETDSEFRPENWWSEHDPFLFGAFEAYLQGRLLLVLVSVGAGYKGVNNLRELLDSGEAPV